MINISKAPEWNLCFDLLLDDKVSEIETNGPHSFFMKKSGQRIELNIPRLSEEMYFDGIEKGLAPFVKSQNVFDRDAFIFEGRLEFSYQGKEVKGRCHVVLPPASDYPQVTIAKKTTSLLSLEAIASAGSMSTEMMNFLKMCIQGKRTLALSGMTGAGKTTMLEALSKYISNEERIGVAEDVPELKLLQENVTYLHSTPWSPGMNPNNVATLDWVVAQFMRNRCDRLIVGETRGKEFAGFLTAANSGMEGGLTTIHADDPVACLRKMSNFTLEARSSVPIRAVNNDIANAVDIIVQLIILPDGRHRVSHIQEIVPVLGNTEEATITTQSLYLYDPTTDSFFKEGQMSDKLREIFVHQGFKIDEFLNSPIKQRVKAHIDPNSVKYPVKETANNNDRGFINKNPFASRKLPTSPINSRDGRSI